MMKKSFLMVTAVAAMTFAPLVSALDITELQNGLNAFAEKTPASLPLAASAGIDWSNAYIGQLIDTDFPFIHLGVGLSMGATTIPEKAIGPLLVAMGVVSKGQAAPLPFAVANARIGGLILPFDIGLKVGFLPTALQKVDPFDFTYQNFGVDFRYNLIKSDILMPDISVGAGINFLKAGIGVTLGEAQTYSNPYNSAILTVGAPRLAVDLEAMDFEAKAQISKTLLFLLTPYAGATLGFGTAKSKAGVTATVSSSDSNLTQWEPYTGPLSNVGFAKTGSASPFFLKVYGGASLNVLIIKLDVQGMYNLLDGSIGGSVGLRAQL